MWSKWEGGTLFGSVVEAIVSTTFTRKHPSREPLVRPLGCTGDSTKYDGRKLKQVTFAAPKRYETPPM